MNMKLLVKGIAAGGLMALMAVTGSCSGRNSGRKDAVADYNATLQDSITSVKSQIDSCKSAMEAEDLKRLDYSRDFTTVSNEREAAPYMIYNDFVGKYPPKSTCIIARMAENGQFELVAALSGTRFDQISVTAADETVATDVVAPDQGMNYMADGLNTVMFDGPDADRVGRLIADNELNGITVAYLNNGRPVKAWSVPTDYANMIMMTFRYYDTLRKINSLQMHVPMLERKIQVLQRHLKTDGQQNSKTQESHE